MEHMILSGSSLQPGVPSTGSARVDAVIISCSTIIAITAGAIQLYITKVKPYLMSLKRDTSVIREHTENNHGQAANPNLRDDLDAKHHEITSQLRVITTTLGDLDKSQQRVDSELQRIHVEVGALRSDVAVERGRINKMMDK